MSKIAKFQLHLEAAFGENFWSFFCILKVPLSIILLIEVFSKLNSDQFDLWICDGITKQAIGAGSIRFGLFQIMINLIS